MGLAKYVGRAIGWLDRYLLAELAAIVFSVLLVHGDLTGQGWISIITAIALTILLGQRIWRLSSVFSPQGSQAPYKTFEAFQLELLVLCVLYFLIQLTGSTASALYPILYVFLAAVGGFDASLCNRMGIVMAAWILELLAWLAPGTLPTSSFAIHLVAIAGFPFVVGALEWTWIQAERKKRDAQVEAMMRHADRQAEEYRFSGLTAREKTQTSEVLEQNRRKNLQRSSVKQLGISVANMLAVLEAALRPHTVAIYWLSLDEKTVTLMDASTSGDYRLRDSMEAKEGIMGAMLMGNNSICRNHLLRPERWLGYYAGNPPPLRSFLGVPLMDNTPGSSAEETQHLRGFLLADRKVDLPFGDDDEKLMRVVGREILRIWKTERQLNRMDLIKNEAQGLYDATEGLIKALSFDEVAIEVARSLRGIYQEADFVCVVLRNQAGSSLVIKAVDADERFGPWMQAHLHQELPKTHHLCDLAVRKGIIVPNAAFDKRIRSQRKIFGDKHDPPGLKSVKVAPLKLPSGQQENIGALVVGSTSALFFDNRIGRFEDVKRTLETVSNIAAISIQNARRYERLQTMATTDALTSLNNRRRFFEIMDSLLAEGIRYKRPLSLILTDVDHFKQVNDNYGHPVGDQVLKRIAGVFIEHARETDHVCRYGGEEFAIIMPQTDKMGAILLAERFRSEIKKQEFEHQAYLFKVSLSFGICTYPVCASGEQELIQRADQALYRSKKTGRDRVIHYGDME